MRLLITLFLILLLSLPVLAADSISPAANALSANPGQTIYFPFAFTSEAGGTYSLRVESQNGWPRNIHVDTNGDGVRQSSEGVVTTTGLMAAGQTLAFFAAVNIPAGTLAGSFDTLSVKAANAAGQTVAVATYTAYSGSIPPPPTEPDPIIYDMGNYIGISFALTPANIDWDGVSAVGYGTFNITLYNANTSGNSRKIREFVAGWNSATAPPATITITNNKSGEVTGAVTLNYQSDVSFVAGSLTINGLPAPDPTMVSGGLSFSVTLPAGSATSASATAIGGQVSFPLP
jgi:hypothetical protein